MQRPRDQLSRLNIPPSLNAQQPIGGPAMFSPALPTALQQGFHPPFPVPGNPLHTPMQPFFKTPPPQAPGRPSHRPGSASLAHFGPPPGLHPPGGFPMTPVGGHFSRPSFVLPPGGGGGGGGQLPPFPHRNRRQPSIGGPPKAVLGGPARKLSPIPPGTSISPAPPGKTKKITVNLPKETLPSEADEPPTRPSWARTPAPIPSSDDEPKVEPVELATRESYPPDAWRQMMPEVVDVFLPGKAAWDEMRQQAMEEKLEKLGVERGSGSTVPHIYAPHARAASISNPADPHILLYKLNQLQQSRENSAANSLSASPRPPFGLSPSPHHSTPGFLPPRHAHTMSLAPSYLRSPYEEGASSNPFGHDAILGNDQPQPLSPYVLEGAPLVRLDMNLAPTIPPPPLSAVQPQEGRPDFTRGFGLDIPEEEEPEEEEEEEEEDRGSKRDGSEADVTQDMELDEEDEEDRTHRTASHQTSPFQSRHHSRHASKLSAHLSLGSFGGSNLAPSMLHERTQESIDMSRDGRVENEPSHTATDDGDAVGEWTGTDSSDGEESIGEWSNPSDEERARRQRVERRLRRRAAKLSIDKPRRIPNFPRPPDNTSVFRSPGGGKGGGVDLISNPSEENIMLSHSGPYLGVDAAYFSPARSSQVLPHSRSGSAQYSVHDPARARSRTPSDEFVYPGSQPRRQQHQQHQSSFSNRQNLNPFAKPFVFGGLVVTPPIGKTFHNESPASHSRTVSLSNKPLNIAAPEFKPGGFTFRPPPGGPQMPGPHSEFPKSLPPPPRDNKEEGSPFVTQGREKRQRRGSSASLEEGDSMASFKFPRNNMESPQTNMRRSTSYSGAQTQNNLNPSAEPFTFSTFSAVVHPPLVPPIPGHVKDSDVVSPEEVTLQDVASPVNGDGAEYTAPPSAKKRAPIPLDFKHPVASNNTVPAGLFKALANEERTRKSVRSRLSSREIYDHGRRPSMDDNDVPQIAHSRSQGRLGGSKGTRGSISDDDVFGTNHHHSRRRSSLPDNLGDLSSVSHESVPPMDLTSRMELHRIEHVVGDMLDTKFTELRHEIAQSAKKNGHALNPSTEAQISDVISLFRTQLQESAARSLEDTQMDARGEMDFQLIRDVVKEGQKELMALVRQELKVTAATNGHVQDVKGIVEGAGNMVIHAIRESISDMAARQEAISHAAPARERDALADKLATALTPTIASLRTEPIDYDFLTAQLTQAVKPHITQLIDLASDKRETAGLIMESLIPLLPSINSPQVDTDAITLQLITEVRRAIAPIDAFEIREQVADLVVERLDSRLAVRDKAFNVDTISAKVNESMSQMLEPSRNVPGMLENVVEAHKGLKARQEELNAGVKHVTEAVEKLPAKFDGGFEGVLAGQKDVLSKLESLLAPKEKDGVVLEIKTLVEALAEDQTHVIGHNDEALSLNKDILAKVQAIPDFVSTNTIALQTALFDLIRSRDSTNKEIEDLRKANTDFQVQLAKARSAHGQVRVEKDAMGEKLSEVEAERERLRVQVKELEKASTTKANATTVLETRNAELEEALSKALSRLQAADVTSQANKDQIANLEKAQAGMTNAKVTLEAKIMTLEMQSALANREKETAVHALEALQRQHGELASQQSHWNDLRQASEKIDLLANLIGQADNEELQELRRFRDQTKMIEVEYDNLQKRFKDLESKFVANERNLVTTRQSLLQNQQRSTEWEERAKEAEGQLEALQTKLDQSEQMHAQLDADYSLAKLQLEEREAEDRSTKDRENRARETVNALEAKVRTLQAELEKKTGTSAPAPIPALAPTQRSNTINGHVYTPTRPDSRTSTIYGERSGTPTRRMTSYVGSSTTTSTTPPQQPSVWDSMHAPPRGTPVKYPTLSSVHAPTGRYPSNLGRATPKSNPLYRSSQVPARQASPAMSVVSNAPTLRDDGWWD